MIRPITHKYGIRSLRLVARPTNGRIRQPSHVFLTTVLFSILVASSLMAERIPIDGYAAIVNDRVITLSEVLAFVQPVEKKLRMVYNGRILKDKLDEAFQDAINALIENKLILEEFETEEIGIPDQLIDSHITQIVQERFDNNKSEFTKALKEDRISLSQWREQVRDRLIIMLLRRREILDKIDVSPTSSRQTYETNKEKYQIPEKAHVRMIVVQKGKNKEEIEVKRKEAKRIRRQLAEGKDFGTLAKSVSEGSKASSGGDWGWINPMNLRKKLAQAITTVPISQISDIIDMGNEFYIIKVEARKSAGITPFEDVRDAIEQTLKSGQEDHLYRDWIDGLKKKHYVKVF
ncbi:MAG: hypothetical protein GKR87_09565 [Kiritimatiellae bacterium]|nr:hypothetical protein [Kiritimatiellia bacterium]